MKKSHLVDTGLLIRYLEDLKKDELKEMPVDIVDSYFAEWLMTDCEDPYSLVSLKKEAFVCLNMYRNVMHELEVI